jgi:hypothetical protein
MFGFSRGAYTARGLAGMIHKVRVCSNLPFINSFYARSDSFQLPTISRYRLRTKCSCAWTRSVGSNRTHSRKPSLSTSRLNLLVSGRCLDSPRDPCILTCSQGYCRLCWTYSSTSSLHNIEHHGAHLQARRRP